MIPREILKKIRQIADSDAITDLELGRAGGAFETLGIPFPRRDLRVVGSIVAHGAFSPR